MIIEERHIEILNLVKLGWTNAEIASRLFMSTETVKKQLVNIRKELGARNCTHAVYIAVKLGIIK